MPKSLGRKENPIALVPSGQLKSPKVEKPSSPGDVVVPKSWKNSPEVLPTAPGIRVTNVLQQAGR